MEYDNRNRRDVFYAEEYLYCGPEGLESGALNAAWPDGGSDCTCICVPPGVSPTLDPGCLVHGES